MIRTVTIEIDDEFDEFQAAEFWEAMNVQHSDIVDQLLLGDATISIELWDKLQQLPGFDGGPSYAPCALVLSGIVECGVFEAHPSADGCSWCVVDGRTGVVVRRDMERSKAIATALSESDLTEFVWRGDNLQLVGRD